MATIQQVKAEAAARGVTVNYDRAAGELDAWSPKGWIFTASGCHCVAHHFERGPWAAGQLAHMLEDLQDGLTKCTDPDCDTCNEELQR